MQQIEYAINKLKKEIENGTHECASSRDDLTEMTLKALGKRRSTKGEKAVFIVLWCARVEKFILSIGRIVVGCQISGLIPWKGRLFGS